MTGTYKLVHDPSHPLAHRTGGVSEHRRALFAAIGPGSHPCTYCGTMLTWGDDLHVDHVDGDKSNNDPSNLAPSCNPCNVRRALNHGPAPSAPHGTVSAYKRHLRHKEPPCASCRKAWADYHRTRYATHPRVKPQNNP